MLSHKTGSPLMILKRILRTGDEDGLGMIFLYFLGIVDEIWWNKKNDSASWKNEI